MEILAAADHGILSVGFLRSIEQSHGENVAVANLATGTRFRSLKRYLGIAWLVQVIRWQHEKLLAKEG